MTFRMCFFFFFSSRRRHTRFKCDWSSDVCSSDLTSDYPKPAKSFDFISKLLEFFQGARHGGEAFVDQGEDGSRIKFPVAVSLPGRRTGKYLDALFDFGNGPDVKFSGGHRFQNIFAQHQVLDVGIGHHHTLRAGKAFNATDVEESFDFFVYSANGLNSALLVDRASHRDILPQRQSGKRRGQRIDFRRAGAVAIDSRVGLLEADAGSEQSYSGVEDRKS